VKRDASPSARALLALETIEGSPGITAERLADRLGVSERAARRYVDVLREAGIPIDSLRGPYGGYRTGRGLRLPPLMFSGAEALGLVMAVLDGHHQAGDPADPAGSALGKIVRALPEPVAASVDAVRRSAAAAPDRAAARPHPATAAAIVQASADRRRVRMDYRSEAGSQWVAEIDPWAVVVRHGRWYVLCFAHTVGAQRAYRIDRIGAVELLDDSFDPPADLDPIAMLEEHLATGWEYGVDVVFHAPIETVGRAVPRALGRLEAVGGTRTRLAGSTSNPTWYASQLAAIPVPYRVAGGPEVREAVLALGRRAVAACRPSRRSTAPTAPGHTERDR
jgi:predicted DNA-binding transcriptional regulator YafY